MPRSFHPASEKKYELIKTHTLQIQSMHSFKREILEQERKVGRKLIDARRLYNKLAGGAAFKTVSPSVHWDAVSGSMMDSLTSNSLTSDLSTDVSVMAEDGAPAVPEAPGAVLPAPEPVVEPAMAAPEAVVAAPEPAMAAPEADVVEPMSALIGGDSHDDAAMGGDAPGAAMGGDAHDAAMGVDAHDVASMSTEEDGGGGIALGAGDFNPIQFAIGGGDDVLIPTWDVTTAYSDVNDKNYLRIIAEQNEHASKTPPASV